MTGSATLASFMVLLSLALPVQNPKQLQKQIRNLEKLERKFQDQKGAVHQAKVLAKLLPKEVQMAAEEIREGEFDQGVERLERWSDQAEEVHDALIATGRNPVKKPAGFTDLQVALRESIRGLRNIIFSLPLGRRHRAEGVRANLSQINSQLLQELFPPPPPPKKEKKK